MRLLGIILIVAGVLALIYGGIQYTSRDKVVDLGPLQVSADQKHNIPLPPIVGGLALVAGIALVLTDRRKS
jgi:UDP-N-acetylmuramyl pentapeptide phosphotransferase/UDP-N-acetylglucosamine-1-phosphate transferase